MLGIFDGDGSTGEAAGDATSRAVSAVRINWQSTACWQRQTKQKAVRLFRLLRLVCFCGIASGSLSPLSLRYAFAALMNDGREPSAGLSAAPVSHGGEAVAAVVSRFVERFFSAIGS